MSGPAASDEVEQGRRVMVVAELAGGVGWLAVMLAGSPTMLVAAALVATSANAPFRAASSASIPNLVPSDQLSWANGVIATAGNASLVAGPLVGGVIVGAVGPRAVFGLNVVSFLVSGALIARMSGRFSEDRAPDGAAPSLRWRTVLGDRYRRRLFAVTALSFAAFGVTLVADLPLVDHFGGGSVGYALLTSLWGTGAVVGSMAATRLTVRHERRRWIACLSARCRRGRGPGERQGGRPHRSTARPAPLRPRPEISIAGRCTWALDVLP
jgi:MFS family permease